MRIVHIAPNSPYNDYWGYQDNLLPKYHKKLNHDVTVIITNTMHKDGKIVETDCCDYVLNDGVRVIRKKYKRYFCSILTKMNSCLPVFATLTELKPDFIFYHGLISTTIFDVIRYKKHINHNCVIVQDNHLDYNIGRSCRGVKEWIIRAWHREVNRRSIKHVTRVYGVTPWRKTYAEDYFNISPEKTDVLIMGADDDMLNLDQRSQIRTEVRNKFKIADSDFLIVTGGKIDIKKKIHLLMHACKNLDNVKLLVFGSVNDDIKTEFNELLKNSSNIIYVGWIKSEFVYDYFYAADLIFFPGQHSVLWEQACASKTPCVFEKWEGMDHVDNGGNSDFISPITVESLVEKIKELKYTRKYYLMKSIADSAKTDIYLYSHIARKSLECAKIK
jgi:1,2-diacylglycerol 3-alpha-glucosyltransferase